MKLPDMVRVPEEDAWVVSIARHRLAKNEKTGTPFFDTEEEAIALANGSDYGLSAAVFSGDEARALRVAQRLLAGGISINDASLTALLHEGGKQSFGSSGLGGTRMGVKSIERFYRLQAYLINDGTSSPWWYR